MANRIQIRHGSSIPTTTSSSLLPYELGWNTANKILYINDNNNAIEGIGLRYINTIDNTTWTADTLGATTSIAFTKTNITGAYTTGHMVWLNANDIGTPFQLVVHDSSDLYLYKRWKSSGTWQAWTKMRAGYADSAGSATSATNANALNFVHTNELILGNETSQSRVWFNYRRVQGGAASGNTAITEYRFGNSNGGTTGVTLYADSFTGTAAKASGLVDGTSTMTSAYNKAGLAYGDYTWLAGWNGYELRAVNKNQFAQASHTHSYLPLTGGTVTGTLTVGSSSAASSSSHALWTTGITVHDTRYDAISVTSLSKAINFFFSNNGMPNTNWWAGMHVAGWTGDYNAWELVGPSHSSDQRAQNLCIRVGRTSNGWGAWRALVTSSDTTSRRIFVTTSASVPSGAAAGDIVLVKA